MPYVPSSTIQILIRIVAICVLAVVVVGTMAFIGWAWTHFWSWHDSRMFRKAAQGDPHCVGRIAGKRAAALAHLAKMAAHKDSFV